MGWIRKVKRFFTKEELSQKQQFVKQFQDTLGRLFVKIMIVNGLTVDPAGNNQKDYQERYSGIVEAVFPLFNDWADDQKLSPEERKEMGNYLSEKKNPVLNQFYSFAKFIKFKNELSVKEKRILDRIAGKDIRAIASLFADAEKLIGRMQKIFLEETAIPAAPAKPGKTSGEAEQNIEKYGVPDPENWVVLPGKDYAGYSYPDLLVSLDLFHFDKSWNNVQEIISKNGFFMLTIRQFLDFFAHLAYPHIKSPPVRDAKGDLLSQKQRASVVEGIRQGRDKIRGEFLDAYFIKQQKVRFQWLIKYHTIEKTGQLKEVTVPLGEETLVDAAYMEFDEWFKSADIRGLPRKGTTSSNSPIFYTGLQPDAVAIFRANSPTMAVLDCQCTPEVVHSGIGVRLAKIRKKIQ